MKANTKAEKGVMLLLSMVVLSVLVYMGMYSGTPSGFTSLGGSAGNSLATFGVGLASILAIIVFVLKSFAE